MGAYRLTRKADEDLANLYRHGIETFGLDRADAYFDSLILRLEHIGHAPPQFQKSDYREGYRRSAHHPHSIYFRIVDSTMVEIVRILRSQDSREDL